MLAVVINSIGTNQTFYFHVKVNLPFNSDLLPPNKYIRFLKGMFISRYSTSIFLVRIIVTRYCH